MKALTVRQPWASLLVFGVKRIETRSWNTRHVGTLAIHAGSAMPCRIGQTIDVGAGYSVERDSKSGLLLRGPGMWPYRLPVGAIIGTVDLIYTRKTTNSEYAPDDRDLALGDHSPGRWGWYTSTIRDRFRHPITCPGRLGLWDVPDDIAERAS